MKKVVIPVFIGGALGAILREVMMLIVPVGPRGFPYDILIANVVAACLLGFVKAMHTRKIVSDGVFTLIGVGVAGGLSTFSSFVYAMALLTSRSMSGALVALAYAATSLIMGYIAVGVGQKLGGYARSPA